MPENYAQQLREVEYINNTTQSLRAQPGILYPLLARNQANYHGKSEAKIEDRYGRLKLQKKTERNGDTNNTDPTVVRRFIKRQGSSNVAPLIDRDDQADTSVNLESPLVIETRDAVNTYHDDQVLKGFWGPAWEGTKTAETEIAFTAGNKIAHNFTGASTGLVLPKLIELQRQLGLSNVSMQKDKPIILLDPDAASELLAIEEYKNSRYSGSTPLVEGEINPFMGFRFFPINLGDTEAFPEASQYFTVGGMHRLPVIIPRYLHRGVWTEFWGKISDRGDKAHSEQIFAEAESRVVRTDEKACWYIETKPVGA